MSWMRKFEQEWTDNERQEYEANYAAMEAGDEEATARYKDWFEWMIDEPIDVEDTGDGLRLYHRGKLIHDDSGPPRSSAIARFYRGDA
jgi:hypothetical protein